MPELFAMRVSCIRALLCSFIVLLAGANLSEAKAGSSQSSVETVRTECMRESTIYCPKAGSAQLIQCLYEHRTSLSQRCRYYLESLSFGKCNADAMALCKNKHGVKDIEVCLQQRSSSVDRACRKNLEYGALSPSLIEIVRSDMNQRTTLVTTICSFYVVVTILGLGWIVWMTLQLFRVQSIFLSEKRRGGLSIEQASILHETEQGDGDSVESVGFIGLQDLSYQCYGSPHLNFEEVGCVFETRRLSVIVGTGSESVAALLSGHLLVGELIGRLNWRGSQVSARQFVKDARVQGYADWSAVKALPSLSVWQTLLHYALLVPTGHEGYSNALNNAWRVMREVGLIHAADSKQDLTLAQKVRVVLGIELLRSPQFLVCSGLLKNLTGAYARELIILLQEIALKRAIPVVLSVGLADAHKVSALEAIDKVMVLGKAGRMLCFCSAREFSALSSNLHQSRGMYEQPDYSTASDHDLGFGETLRNVLGPPHSTNHTKQAPLYIDRVTSTPQLEDRDENGIDYYEDEAESLLVGGGDLDEHSAATGLELMELNSAEAEEQAQLRGRQTALRIRYEESEAYDQIEQQLQQSPPSTAVFSTSSVPEKVPTRSTQSDIVTSMTEELTCTVRTSASTEDGAFNTFKGGSKSIRQGFVPPLTQIWVMFSMNTLSGGSLWWQAPSLLAGCSVTITLILALTAKWNGTDALYQAENSAGLLGNIVIIAVLMVSASLMYRQQSACSICGGSGGGGERVQVSVWAIMFREILNDVPEAFAVSVACMITVYFVFPLNPSTVSVAYALMCMIVGVSAWQAFMAILIAYAKNSVVLAVILPFFVFVSSFFNGLLTSLNEIPDFLRYAGYFFIPAVLQRALISNDLQCCYLSLTCNSIQHDRDDSFSTPVCPYGLYFTGDGSDKGNLGRNFLSEQGLEEDRPAFLLFILFISGVGWRALSARARQARQKLVTNVVHRQIQSSVTSGSDVRTGQQANEDG